MGFLKDLWHSMVLKDRTTSEKGYISAEERKELIGCKGIVKNELRPAGTMLIEGNPVDVVSEGDYIRKGSLVEVIGVNGSRVVVRQVQN